ncbi:MAG: MipA/OmpV family protein [Methylobacteriaceae bacterium]|nr:MipA/OmpV family protein [Methylobacteriaceae bacterium]
MRLLRLIGPALGAALALSLLPLAADAAPRKRAKAKPAPARVAAPAPAPAPVANPYGWLVTVNAKGVLSPKFAGSRSYGFVGYPTLSFRRPGAPVVWSSPDDSISLRVVETPRFVLGPALAYRGGRYVAQDAALRGLHKPRWTLEAGVFADLWIMPDALRLRGEIRRGLRKEDGFVATLGLDAVQRFDRLTVAIGPRARFGDARFMRHQFGVTALDATRAPRFAPHRPDAGLYALGLYGSATWRANESWAYTLHAGYDRLTGGAASSPIVRGVGSRNQFMVGAIASYTFEWAR